MQLYELIATYDAIRTAALGVCSKLIEFISVTEESQHCCFTGPIDTSVFAINSRPMLVSSKRKINTVCANISRRKPDILKITRSESY